MRRIVSLIIALFIVFSPIVAHASTHRTTYHHASSHLSASMYSPYYTASPYVGEFVTLDTSPGTIYTVIRSVPVFAGSNVSFVYQLGTFGTYQPLQWVTSSQITQATPLQVTLYLINTSPQLEVIS